jgi:hypothetical protein
VWQHKPPELGCRQFSSICELITHAHLGGNFPVMGKSKLSLSTTADACGCAYAVDVYHRSFKVTERIFKRKEVKSI